MPDTTTLIPSLLTLQNQIKVLHWQTNKYSDHKALDNIYEKLGKTIDSLIECYQGKYKNRLSLPEGGSSIKLFNLDKININAFLDRFYTYFSKDIYDLEILSETDLDLQDLVLDILNSINKLRYLLTLD